MKNETSFYETFFALKKEFAPTYLDMKCDINQLSVLDWRVVNTPIFLDLKIFTITKIM